MKLRPALWDISAIRQPVQVVSTMHPQPIDIVLQRDPSAIDLKVTEDIMSPRREKKPGTPYPC